MGTKASRPRAVPDAEQTGDELLTGAAYEIEDADPTPEELLEQFFGTDHSAEDVRCSIYELVGRDHKERGYLFSFPFERGMQCSELFDDLLSRFGAGWYELHAQRRNGKMVTRKVFQLGTARERKPSFVPADAERQRDADNRDRDRDELSPGLAAILEGQNRLIAQLVETQTRAPAPAAPPAPDRLDSLKELIELQRLLEPQRTPASEAFSIVKDVLKLKDELSSDTDDSNPLALLAKHFAPAITKAVERLEQTQGPTAGPGAPPSGAPASTGGLMNLNSMFAQLLELADKKTEPDAAALSVLQWLAEQADWIEESVLGMVFDERERVVSRLVGSYPKLEPHRDWLTQVVQSIIKQVEAGDAAAEQQATPADAPAAP